LDNVNHISKKHLKYLYENLEPQVLNPTILKLSTEKYILKFIKKGFKINEPQYINSDYDKVWSWYLKSWKNFNDENKIKVFIDIAEVCNPNVIKLFLDDIKINFDQLYILLLRLNKNDNEELYNIVELFVKKAKNQIDIKEFGSWYSRRRKNPTNNHDLYLLLNNGSEINKKFSHIATTIFLMEKCIENKSVISDKALCEFLENTNETDKIKKGIELALKSGTKISSNIQILLENKNMNNSDIEKLLKKK
jgi:hypothetical protein